MLYFRLLPGFIGPGHKNANQPPLFIPLFIRAPDCGAIKQMILKSHAELNKPHPEWSVCKRKRWMKCEMIAEVLNMATRTSSHGPPLSLFGSGFFRFRPLKKEHAIKSGQPTKNPSNEKNKYLSLQTKLGRLGYTLRVLSSTFFHKKMTVQQQTIWNSMANLLFAIHNGPESQTFIRPK